jgi:hypothetical protein
VKSSSLLADGEAEQIARFDDNVDEDEEEESSLLSNSSVENGGMPLRTGRRQNQVQNGRLVITQDGSFTIYEEILIFLGRVFKIYPILKNGVKLNGIIRLSS